LHNDKGFPGVLSEMKTVFPPGSSGVEDLTIVLVPYGEGVVREWTTSFDKLPHEQRLHST
jgi:hypothetical protein